MSDDRHTVFVGGLPLEAAARREPTPGRCPSCGRSVGRGDREHDSRTLDHLLESARIVVDWCYVGRPPDDPIGVGECAGVSGERIPLVSTQQFWFVSYRSVMITRGESENRIINSASNVLLAGIHPVVWLATTRLSAPTFARAGGTRYIEFYAPIDEETFSAAVANNYIECEDHREPLSHGTHDNAHARGAHGARS